MINAMISMVNGRLADGEAVRNFVWGPLERKWTEPLIDKVSYRTSVDRVM